MIRVRSGPYAFADFLELVRDDQKADLVDGVIYMASPESWDHNELVQWFAVVIGEFVRQRALGRVSVNKVAYRLSAATAPEPDIGVVLREHADRMRPGYTDGPPDLAVEIVSPESVQRDYELKREHYERAGVPEYWIIDPDERRATFLILDRGRYSANELLDGPFESRVLPGLRLRVEWLWQRPLPAPLPILNDLLSQLG